MRAPVPHPPPPPLRAARNGPWRDAPAVWSAGAAGTARARSPRVWCRGAPRPSHSCAHIRAEACRDEASRGRPWERRPVGGVVGCPARRCRAGAWPGRPQEPAQRAMWGGEAGQDMGVRMRLQSAANPARAARRSGIRCRANSVELGGNGFARRNRNSDDARRHGSRAGPSPAIHGGAEEETGSTARPPSEQPAQRSAAATLPPRKPKSGSSRGQTLHGGNKNCRAGNRAATRRGISGRVTAEGAWNAGVVGRARRRAANLRHHIKRIGVSPSNLLSGMPQQNLLLDCSLSRERPGAAGPVVGRCRVVHRVQFNHSTSPKTQA